MKALLFPLLLVGCDPFSHWPDNSSEYVDPLWDDEIVAASDGLYVSLPHAGKLVFVSLDGGASEVDLLGASPLRMTLAPDQQSLLVTSTWTVCDDDDPDIREVSDCPEDELRQLYALDLVRGGVKDASFDVPPYLNAFEFTNGGTKAVAYADAESYASLDELEDQALVDLNAVAFLDLDSLSVETVSVGFAASSVLFNEDDSRALVLSQSQAVVVDLSTFKKTVSYPFTLDEDEELNPRTAAFTPDGRYALIAISGSKDLYKLDLEIESIDILSLDGVPADLVVDSGADRTAIVYSGAAQVDLMDHDLFVIESVELETAETDIVSLDGSVLLYNDQNSNVRYAYRLDLDDQELTPYVVTNPIDELHVSDSGAYALALLRPSYDNGSSDAADFTSSHWGLGVLDLAGDDAISVTLTDEPVGVALVDDAETTYALLLTAGSDELLVVDLAHPSADDTVALPAPATRIGTMPDGRFYITHDAALGLVSFLDPASRALESVSGFAALGLLTDDTLPEREEM